MSFEAEALVKTGRDAWRPTDADRARVLGKLAGGAFGAAANRASDTFGDGALCALRREPVRWTLLGLLIVASGSVLLHLGATSALVPSPAHRVGVEVPAEPTQVESAASIPQPVNPAPVAGSISGQKALSARAPRMTAGVQTGDRAAAHASAGDRLHEEIVLLSRAETELYGSHAREALQTLEEHERRFRDGALVEERMAARARALCALGRVAEADAQLVRLSNNSPASPYLARAREDCDRARHVE